MTVRLFRSKNSTLYDYGPDHPESPNRVYAIEDQLLSSGLDFSCQHQDAEPALMKHLLLAHSFEHVDGLMSKSSALKHGEIAWIDDDTGMTKDTFDAALLSAGAGINAVDWVMAGENRSGFCLTRPPGHHATRNQAMGFCFFNNVAIAAYYAMSQYNLSRVAIVDFDVHHGNGTEDIVSGDERVLFCSSFQHPLYPHTDLITNADNVLKVPLDAGTTGDEFRRKVSSWFDALTLFAPELVLISAGFDGHAEDPMAHIRLVESDYFWITQQIAQIAQKSSLGRVVSMLEGGYDNSALSRSVVSHLKALMATNTEMA